METVQSHSRWSWLAIPRVVWLGGAAFGIAVVSAGAAMWLQPAATVKPAAVESKGPELASQPITPAPVAAQPLKVAPAAPVATCATCGVVESVLAVKHKGQGTGLGAVAGGVVGGVVGNQIGKGDGRKAMTVIGAVGGGFAGHEIEKHARAETVYSIRVRMNDGKLRTLTRPQPLAVGTRVTVQGQTLRVARSTPAADGG